MKPFKMSPRIRLRERICWVAEIVRAKIKVFAASRGWMMFEAKKAPSSSRILRHAKEALEHCLAMIDPIIHSARMSRLRKAIEGLQFVKGVLWTLGVCSEKDMADESLLDTKTT